MMNTRLKTSVPPSRGRSALRALIGLAALGACLMLGACDDSIEAGGVGASVGLPSAYADGASDTADIGVGNVHWVGNPRW